MRFVLLILPAFLIMCICEILNFSSPQYKAYIPTIEPFKQTTSLVGMYPWKRGLEPPRVGLQVGHWKHDEAPPELHRLWDNGGTQAAGVTEQEINYAIAVETAKILKREGFMVDILPATVPPWYQADVFVAIHADGHINRRVSGFKVSAPWRDFTGKADDLANLVEEEYAKSTMLAIDPNISENMLHYYAFSWNRFEHAVHPMTPSVIVETGFLTSAHDRRIIVNNQKKSVEGISNAIIRFLKERS